MELEAILNLLSTFIEKLMFSNLLMVFVGGYWFKKISDNRTRNEKVREKMIDFIEEAGSDINLVLSLIFNHLRRNSIEVRNDSELFEMSGELFTKRFLVRVRSKAYLKKDHFWKQYDHIAWELHEIVCFMEKITSHHYQTDEIVTLIDANISWLKKDYPFHNDRKSSNSFDSPVKELFVWTLMVWDRADHLITTHLENALE